jgi:hypothetical protein
MRDPRKQKDKNTANYVLRGKKVLNFIGKGLMSWRRLPGPNLESLSLVRDGTKSQCRLLVFLGEV